MSLRLTKSLYQRIDELIFAAKARRQRLTKAPAEVQPAHILAPQALPGLTAGSFGQQPRRCLAKKVQRNHAEKCTSAGGFRLCTGGDQNDDGEGTTPPHPNFRGGQSDVLGMQRV